MATQKINTLVFACGFAAAAVFAGAAFGAPPVKRLAWNKAAAEWTRLAEARGVPITCEPWVRLVSPSCAFGEYDSVRMFVTSDPCAYSVSVYRRQPPAGPRLTLAQKSWRVSVPICKPPSVWLKTLPVPWRPPAR